MPAVAMATCVVPAAAGPRPPAAAVAGMNDGWDDRFAAPGGASVYALAWDGVRLHAAGNFPYVGRTLASKIAAWDGATWSTLGSGLDSTAWRDAHALLRVGTNLYVGGYFATAGGVTVNGIARWDGSTWSPLGSGMDGGVLALAWDGTYLYAGGDFTTAGGIAASKIARWDGSTWSPLGSGVGGTGSPVVRALSWNGTDLYVGGAFTTAGGAPASNIAHWDGSTWSALGSGTSGGVFAVAWDGSGLYAGGDFTTAGGVVVNDIARWDGSTWSSLGGGISFPPGSVVRCLAWSGAQLAVGGSFLSAGGVPASGVALWDGSAWSALGSGADGDSVYALLWEGPRLFMGGGFSMAGAVPAVGIARWDGSVWSPCVVGTHDGMTGSVRALFHDGSSVYAGGTFRTAGDVPAERVARWDGNGWNPLGTGLSNTVRALAWDGTYLYAGGDFFYAGGAPANLIARWDGTTWSAMGSGMDYEVYALAFDGTSIYAGGLFNVAGGVSALHIARWDGTTWNAVGGGTAGSVRALVWSGASLFAGGTFTSAGGVPARYVARWDGTSWSGLGSGTSYRVHALAWDGSNLYAGGDFWSAGGQYVGLVARWDGSSWYPLGSGLGPIGISNNVRGLSWDGTYLYAGGLFQTAGGVPAESVARWDGTRWTPLGSGVYAETYALASEASTPTPLLWAGGGIGIAGGKPSFGVARFDRSAFTCPNIDLSPATLPPAALGIPYSATLVGTGGVAPYSYFISSGTLPAGLALDPATGVIAGTPTTAGTSIFEVAAVDADSCTGWRSYTITVSPCPTVTLAPATLPDGAEGAPYSQTLTASGGTAPYTFAISSGSLPPGITLSAGGVLVGTPSSQGTFSFTVTATDSLGCPGSRAYSLTICGAIVVGPPGLPAGDEGIPYSQTLTASGGTAPYTFAVSSGSLPPGLALSTGGVLSGTPSTQGTFSFTVTATDSLGCEGSHAYGLTICGAIVVGPPGLPAGDEGIPYSQTLAATGGTPPYGFAITTGTLPPGLSLGAASGVLGGTPAQAGRYAFTVTATDALACTGSRTYTVDVGAAVDHVVGEGLGPTDGNGVRVHRRDGTAAPTAFAAYGAGQWGTNVSSGDIDGGTYAEILTAPGPGAVYGPHVRAWVRSGTPIAKVSFYAYATLRYGANVAAGRVDGDGFHEILAGPGPGEPFGPHVRAFEYDNTSLRAIAKINFFAYGTLKYGVNVEEGLVDGDAFAEILAGAGPGPAFAATVRGFDYDGTAVAAIGKINFNAFSSPFGVNVAGGDADGDGYAEIACAQGPAPANANAFAGFDYDGNSIAPAPGFLVSPAPASLFGGRVGTGDVTGDGAADLQCGAGRDPSAGSTVNVYRYTGSALVAVPPSFTPFAAAGYGYGVNVAGAELGYY